MLANETEWLSLVMIPFLYLQLVSILSDHIVQVNFVQFDDDFTGLGAVIGMLLQCTFKSFCHSVSIQAWVKFFHICCCNVKH